MNSKQQYFVALIPPKNICEEIDQIKQDFSSRFNSSHALRLMPHITIIPPFYLEQTQHSQLLNWFNQLHFISFTIVLDNFGSFPRKQVIFIKPEPNSNLDQLYETVNESFIKAFTGFAKEINPFHPHITVAYRDLTKKMFEKAWEEYESKEYAASFIVEELTLFAHNGKIWEIVKGS